MRFTSNVLLNFAVSNKASFRIMRYAVIFMLMIAYVLIINSTIAAYSNKLEVSASDAAEQGNDEISNGNKIRRLTDTINKIKESSINLKRFMIFIFLIVVVLLISEFLKARKAAAAMDKVVDFARAIAEGDLTQKNINIISHTKLQKIGNALNNIKETLSSIVQNASAAIKHLEISSDDLTASSSIIAQDTKKQICKYLQDCKYSRNDECRSI